MAWNIFKKKKTEDGASAKEEDKKAETKESIEVRIEREIASLPGPIRKQMADPQVKARFIEIAKRMEKDGVDFKNIKQMKKWIKEHESELKEEQANGGPKVETVRKAEGEDVGRNEPCPCGSGKKYKKCCGK